MSKSMSKSYKKRIAKTIRAGIWFFMSLCIFYKLLFYGEDWLLDPIVITISFSSSYFVSRTIKEEKSYKDNKEKIFYYEANWLVGIAIIITFIAVVILSVPNWYSKVIKALVGFVGFQFYHNEIYKLNEEE